MAVDASIRLVEARVVFAVDVMVIVPLRASSVPLTVINSALPTVIFPARLSNLPDAETTVDAKVAEEESA